MTPLRSDLVWSLKIAATDHSRDRFAGLEAMLGDSQGLAIVVTGRKE